MARLRWAFAWATLVLLAAAALMVLPEVWTMETGPAAEGVLPRIFDSDKFLIARRLEVSVDEVPISIRLTIHLRPPPLSPKQGGKTHIPFQARRPSKCLGFRTSFP